MKLILDEHQPSKLGTAGSSPVIRSMPRIPARWKPEETPRNYFIIQELGYHIVMFWPRMRHPKIETDALNLYILW